MGLYATYTLFRNYGWDPMASAVPVSIILAVVGIGVYLLTVRQVLKAGHLSQLLITFGIALVLSELLKSIYTTQPRAVFTTYSYAFTRFAGVRFGIYEFVYLAIALGVLLGLQLFLKKTRLGQATFAVGQNPPGPPSWALTCALFTSLSSDCPSPSWAWFPPLWCPGSLSSPARERPSP